MGIPLIFLLLGTGIYLTFILRGLQFTALIPALYLALIREKTRAKPKGTSHISRHL